VTWLSALTTTQTREDGRASFMRRSIVPQFFAVATDVPPNFKTTQGEREPGVILDAIPVFRLYCGFALPTFSPTFPDLEAPTDNF
jgi:hypothetical protein